MVEKMKPRYIEKLLGKYCKIITKKPGEKKGRVRIGFLEDINYLDNSVIIELKEGIDTIQVENIIAIRSI
jgi:hypothetical protein